jgi:hypothetical protein
VAQHATFLYLENTPSGTHVLHPFSKNAVDCKSILYQVGSLNPLLHGSMGGRVAWGNEKQVYPQANTKFSPFQAKNLS